MFSSNTSGPGVATDPQFNYVTMLLPGNGTNGAQNNTFLDSSTNNFTITRNGNTTQGTFSPYGSNWSNYFDGNGDELTFTTIAVGSSTAFCCEAWVYVNSLAANMVLFGGPSDSTGGADNVQLAIESNGTVGAYFGGSYPSSAAGVITVGVWYHIAWTRSGTTGKIFVNGVEVASGSSTSAGNINRIGSIGSIGTRKWFNGYVSNARIVVGSAVYTSAFTPSTTPLTAITNTQLLTCQSNRFRDASTNNFTPTINGVSVQRFSPFNPTAPYAAGTDGGSGYFDGSGDYLSVADNNALDFGTGDFTVECWCYVNNALTTQTTLFSVGSYNAGLLLRINGGASDELYINGSRALSTTSSANIAPTTNTTIGAATHDTTQDMNGYLSDFRVVKGTAVYSPSSSTVTIPTAPLTAISNTSLLCNFTNAGIIDNAEMNNLETVGNAQISTAQSKFGGGSISVINSYLDGCAIASSPQFAFGTGNWTIEGWFYTSQSGNAKQALIMNLNQTTGMSMSVSTSSIEFRSNGQTDISGSGVSSNTWTHIAWVRSGNTVTIYKDGTSIVSGTYTNSIGPSKFYVGPTGGQSGVDGNTYAYLGYIDDLRITKGVARYTANFTPPSAPFPTN